MLQCGGAAAVQQLLQKALDWPLVEHTTCGGSEATSTTDASSANPGGGGDADDGGKAACDDTSHPTADEDEEYDDDDDIGNYGEIHELRLVVSGFLLNLTNSCDTITVSATVSYVAR